MFKKLFSFLALFLFLQTGANADELGASINDILNSFDFDRDSVISISLKDKSTDLTVYEKNSYKFLNPASTLKLFSMAASLDTLGQDFKFNTAFYKDENGNYYLKLAGDPLLTEEDLNTLAQNLKNNNKSKINKIFIDDTVLDKIPYPDGWMYDDIWPNAPKISPYMVDYNTVKVNFFINEDKKTVKIIQKSPYKFAFVNCLEVSNKTDIKFEIDETHNTINVTGTIAANLPNYEVPVLNPKYFFCKKMNDSLNRNGIAFHDKFLFKKTPDNAKMIASFSRPIEDVVRHILSTSDNLACEMVFKVAGAKFAEEKSPVKTEYSSFGTTQNGINMFQSYYKKLGLDPSQARIRDGSGVSRYNVLNTNWMANAISKMNFDFAKYLPTADEGTLSKRMRPMKDKVYFKTGTLYGISSLAGIINTGKEYSYASIIMDYNRNKSLIKGVEDEIVYEIYRMGENEEN